MDDQIPPITPEQAHKAALHVVTHAGEDVGLVLDMLGIREVLRAS